MSELFSCFQRNSNNGNTDGLQFEFWNISHFYYNKKSQNFVRLRILAIVTHSLIRKTYCCGAVCMHGIFICMLWYYISVYGMYLSIYALCMELFQ